jgi:restriction system protein
MKELRTYLLAKYTDRFKVHPKKYEELVAAIFSDFGYRVRVTSFSGDDGIDIFILDGNNNNVVGIQVKRYKKKIEAEQIRSFAGALIFHGITNGIFITASDYRSGAITTAQSYRNKGISILLQDATSFYDKMRIVQRPPYESRNDPSAPFFSMCQSPDKIPYLWTHAW